MFHSDFTDNQSKSNAQCNVSVQNNRAFAARVPRDVYCVGIPRGSDRHVGLLRHNPCVQLVHSAPPPVHGRAEHRVLHAGPVLLRSMVSRMPNGDA